MKIKLSILIILLLGAVSLAAQEQTATLKGRVVTRLGRAPIANAKVTINAAESVTTNEQGEFAFNDIRPGRYTVAIDALDFQPIEVTTNVAAGVKDLGMLILAQMAVSNMVDDSNFTEFDTESGNDAQSMPVSLSASKDIFDQIASYTFGAMRFKRRGYDTSSEAVMMNGIYLNDALTGYSPWSLWSGLNDVVRDQEVTEGLVAGDAGVGTINGTTNIITRASTIRQGFRASVANASGQYRFRGMLTYGSGLSKNGWAYAMSVSTRQGGNDWVNGVYYNTLSYFLAVEKKFNDCHSLAFSFLGAPTIRGAQAAATQEVYDLVGSNYYNPNWGYQGDGYGNSNMRNARVRNNHEPLAMLNYYYTPNNTFKLQAGASFRFGRNGYSALDWSNASDPRPDYYRNLPSYTLQSAANPNLGPVQGQLGWIDEGWNDSWQIRQLNWNALYDFNSNSHFSDVDVLKINNPNVTTSTLRSQYVLEERRTDQKDANLNVSITKNFNDGSLLNAGVAYRWNETKYFKKMKDLLGGDYWLDVDKFAEDMSNTGEEVQNNTFTPNRVVQNGDTYGYSYKAHLQNARLWADYKFNYRSLEGFVAAAGGYTEYYREGLYRKGLFPDNSYGDSEKHDFFTYTAKLGLTEKLSSSHTISANVGYMTEAPFFNEAFVSPRTRNTSAPGLEASKTFSVDLSYMFRYGSTRIRVSGYYTTIKDQNDLISFYDDTQANFVNFSLWGINQMNTGLEIGFTTPLYKSINIKGALNYGYYKYTNNPYVTETVDNSNRVIIDAERVYWKDYKVSGTPQTAASLGLDYRSRKNLFLGIDGSYYDANYIDMNPFFRTDYAHVNLTEAQSQKMAKQEMFPSAFLLNANIGKMWTINRKYTIGANLNVNNILNTKTIKTGGYEQMRLRKNDDGSFSPFDSKYFYLFGTTYYLNVYFRF